MIDNRDEMVEVVRDLVSCESPSADLDAVRACAQQVASHGERILGATAEFVELGGRPHLRWKGADARVLVLGHLDTVWPLGTIDRWPFDVKDGIATGPGVFDMKAGLVQGFYALAELGSLDGVDLFVSSDEELGASSSREYIEQAARDAAYTLVLEPSEKGALKIARKGCSTYEITVHGRASHAGLDPIAGRNALVEVAHQVLEIAALAEGQTTVTPTVARVGTASNTVPALGTLLVDSRVPSMEERQRVDDAMMSLRPHIDDVTIDVERTTGHPPLPRSASDALFERAKKVAASIGLAGLDGVEVGGASDGNFTAAAGCPTLDGLGPVGGGAHAEGEHIVVDKMPERAQLVAALISDLLKKGDV